MNPDTSKLPLPSLTADYLTDPTVLADNVFANLWRQLKMKQLLGRSGFHKRSGLDAPQVVYLLLMWVWLKRESLGMFARRSLQSFAEARKDVLYDFMAREDLNWREAHARVAITVYRGGPFRQSRRRAYVLDDSVKIRRGKRMEGVSLHFDHLSGRTVKGQQILTLGLACEEAFMPLDSDLYISSRGAHELKAPFEDGRSVEARRYREARERSKPELADAMLRRAQRQGLEADYLLADAWFGTKRMINTALDLQLTPILRMKKSKMLYRLSLWREAQRHYRRLNAKQLYRQCVRKHWQKVAGLAYQVCPLEVELNLADPHHSEQWVTVRLLFVRGLADIDQSPEANRWALFLTTDLSSSPATLLEIYAWRWGIEVYFKEAKQHLGLLWEQTETFASHIASIHLTAIRFCLLLYAKLQGSAERIGQLSEALSEQLTGLDFGQQLWTCFRTLIDEAISGLKPMLGNDAEMLMDTIDEQVANFFARALQLDEFTLQMEASNEAVAEM